MGVERERLLAEERLAGCQRRFGEGTVVVGGRADVDGVDVVGGDELLGRGDGECHAGLAREAGAAFVVGIADADELAIDEAALDEVVGRLAVGGAHAARADDADPGSHRERSCSEGSRRAQRTRDARTGTGASELSARVVTFGPPPLLVPLSSGVAPDHPHRPESAAAHLRSRAPINREPCPTEVDASVPTAE